MKIFQYGSNLSSVRLNGPQRLQGRATVLGVAHTRRPFQLSFPVWGGINGCAAAGILPGGTQPAWGVVYEIPEDWVARGSAAPTSLDAIEDEGRDYRRDQIELCWANGTPIDGRVETYLPLNPGQDLQTEFHYVRHILLGALEHDLPADYRSALVQTAIENNPNMAEPIDTFLQEMTKP